MGNPTPTQIHSAMRRRQTDAGPPWLTQTWPAVSSALWMR